MKEKLTTETVLLLRKEKKAIMQLKLLKLCSGQYPVTVKNLKEYHDVLLFICAFPLNQKNYQIAKDELRRLATIIKHDFQKPVQQHALSGSGLPFTNIQSQYSAAIVQWLITNFPDNIKPVDAITEKEISKEFFHALMPGAEFQHTTQGEWNFWKRIQLLCGEYYNTAALQWLLHLLNCQTFSPQLKDQLYNSLKIFVQWNLTDDLYSRSFLHYPVKQIVYADKEKKKAISLTQIKGIKKIPLNESEKNKLISIARASLALLYRETDPVTYAAVEETSYFEMEAGISILLTGMEKEHQLSLDSYVGYLVFKNGIPVAYGGGWMFGFRCKIGVNIFPAFRGSESAFIFKQVLRLYYSYFKVKRFVVRPYQFGKGNTEGLKSGAFWFYYKLGFKPVSENLKSFAAEEWKQIQQNKQYRSSVKSLKKLTQSDLELLLNEDAPLSYETGRISAVITNYIINHYQGNRTEAINQSSKQMMRDLKLKSINHFSKHELAVWNNWSLVWVCLPGASKWNTLQRKEFLNLVQLKASGPEQSFILALQKNKVLLHALDEMVNRI